MYTATKETLPKPKPCAACMHDYRINAATPTTLAARISDGRLYPLCPEHLQNMLDAHH
jgi:hypothetical protein